MFERAEHPKIYPPVPQEPGFPQNALMHESQASRNRATALIPDRAPDLDAVKAVIPKRASDHRTTGARHNPASALRLIQPVADADTTVQLINVMVTD